MIEFSFLGSFAVALESENSFAVALKPEIWKRLKLGCSNLTGFENLSGLVSGMIEFSIPFL